MSQVCKTPEGHVMTLSDVFESMGLVAAERTVDDLDMHAVSIMFFIISVADLGD